MLGHMDKELPRLRVLVVDDDEDILELVGEYLRVRGHSVQTRTDPAQALETLRDGRLDVLVANVAPGAPGGFDLLAEAATLDRPVATLLMTAHGTVDLVLRAMREGAGNLLLKPFRLRELHDAVLRAVERNSSDSQGSRSRELANFYELCLSVEERSQFPVLLRELVNLAKRETQAEEAALWLIRPTGWECVVQTGPLQHLGDFTPEPATETRVLPSGLAQAPVRYGGRRVGVVVVGGGRRRTAQHQERLVILARAASLGLARLGEARAMPEREGGRAGAELSEK